MGRYLVTGGCGFIGSHLAVSLIADGHAVVILDNLSTGAIENAPPEATLIEGDIRNRALVGRLMSAVDGCFHLAAIASVQKSNDDWAGTHAVNLSATIGIFDAARQGKKPIPVVYASSAAVYGNPAITPVSEDTPCHPMTAYGADKLGCELHARVAGLIHGVPTAGMRFFNVFGPRQDPQSPYSGVISIFVDRALRGETVTVHGDGKQIRDFIHVSDVVRHLRAGMGAATINAPVFNVCTGHATSVIEVANNALVLAGRSSPPLHGPARTGDIRASVGNPARARGVLRVRALMEFEEGLAQLISLRASELGLTIPTAPEARRLLTA